MQQRKAGTDLMILLICLRLMQGRGVTRTDPRCLVGRLMVHLMSGPLVSL